MNGLASSSASKTLSPASRKSGPSSLLPLTMAPSQLRPIRATGDPNVAGAKPISLFRSRRFGYVVTEEHDRVERFIRAESRACPKRPVQSLGDILDRHFVVSDC